MKTAHEDRAQGPAPCANAARREAVNLDSVGVRHGSDLSSLGRNLLRDWERFLAPLREEALDILDIGVGSGSSLRTWSDWFRQARLFGLEARRVAIEPPVRNCRVFFGSQADPDILHDILREGRFRVIVDDGSRRAEDQIGTFVSLFPWLEGHGVYICAGLPYPVAGNGGDSDRRAAANWFADLGRALIGGGEGPIGDAAAIAMIQRKATGVYLMRGSAIVVSGDRGVPV